MTPLHALQQVASETIADFNHCIDEPFEKVTLIVCDTCTQALLADLAGFFPPLVADHTRSLVGSHVFGCAFQDGPADQCALHALLQEEYAP